MAAWEDNLRKINPYVPGEQPVGEGIIKLNTNENPYPPAPGVERAIREFNPNQLRLYPNAKSQTIVNALAEFYGRKENEIFVGVGSDDVLATAYMALFNSNKPILFPDLTYSFYDVWADLFHVPYIQKPVDENFRIKKEDYFCENGGIILANPNAPTSIYEPVSVIEEILQHNEASVVIVDEAYIDFGGTSALGLIDRYPNLLIVQTFSKARSMAGMRVGYAIGNPVLISAMNDVKYSYNSYTMNQPSLYYAVEAVKDKEYFEKTLEKVIATRERAKKKLSELGFLFPDSMTNFLFVTHPKLDIVELFDTLRKQNIFVRHFDKQRINQYLRISIGTDEQMDILFQTIETYRNNTINNYITK